jgi:site-specific DNA-methyltransferase (adenine-specific)
MVAATPLAAQSQLKLFDPTSSPPTDRFSVEGITLYHADVVSLYDQLSSPTVIVSDGAYGLGLFPNDPHQVEQLTAWYRPHIEAWSQFALPETTLWFWNSELGWATVHPLLVAHGWRYVSCHIWDKGIAHAAGNSNTQTLRKFPVVTEVCVQYVREVQINGLSLRDWLRKEWERTGIPFYKANEACGVKNAATRKYLTKDHLWYFPPPDAFMQMAAYANRHGKPSGLPYFSRDGKQAIQATEWAQLRAKFYCKPGITNVWHSPALNGSERVKIAQKSVHLNQKPLKLLDLIIESSSDTGDMIWEPFGGLCSTAVSARRLGRRCISAETERDFFDLAVGRFV